MTKADNYYRRHRADRDDWRFDVPERCMWCGRGIDRSNPMEWFEIHEMLSRAQAPLNAYFKANYLLVHNSPCHEEAAAARHVVQLAHKLKYDPENFNLSEWLTRRNPNAMEYVTVIDIDEVFRVQGWHPDFSGTWLEELDRLSGRN